jgi:uncharacterized protein
MKTEKKTAAAPEVRSARGPGAAPNRLRHEKSPYLLQHADNPVRWYPWGEDAFAAACRLDRPVFLSIGYSTCHWCHVMAHESFENPHIALLLNETFICVKVDREERPDIDSVYMRVCQMLTGSGGWPLTIIMTADKKPFYAATYIPPEARFGRPGMLDLIPHIAGLWTTKRASLLSSANEITTALQRPTVSAGVAQTLDESLLHRAFGALRSAYDPDNGGFGRAPKFPTPHNLRFLLRYWMRSGTRAALDMACETLRRMRRGGIYDHIGFGFHRYSTDPYWLVPHFEKMLYDQALLAMAYTEAYSATGEEDFKSTALEIFTCVLRDLQAPDGGFYCAEDADSEGREGAFYLWDEREIRQVLSLREARLACAVYSIRADGNFSDEASGRTTGSNILYHERPLRETARRLGMPLKELRRELEVLRQKLFDIRSRRPRPHRDDKVLTDWNGLMIAALAMGAGMLRAPHLLDAATNAAGWIVRMLRRPDGRLLHRYRDGEASIPAHADDHAFMIWALLELYAATFDARHLQTALELSRVFEQHFWDPDGGGFFTAADDTRDLIVRQKEIYDGALPSANSVAMLNMLRLARMTGNSIFAEQAAQLGRMFAQDVSVAPHAHTHLMLALECAVGPACEIVIVGTPGAPDTRAMLEALCGRFLPNTVVLFKPDGEQAPLISTLAPFTAGYRSLGGRATAYVCRRNTCRPPTTDPDTMLQQLTGSL